MNNSPQTRTTTPPPSPSFGVRYGNKIALIMVISIVLMICAGIIWAFAYDREDDSTRISDDVAQEWGEEIKISDISFFCPDSTNVNYATLDSVGCSVDLKSEILTRNIFQTIVYKGDVELTGSISENVERIDSTVTDAQFRVDIFRESVIEPGELTVAGQRFPMELDGDRLQTSVPLDLLTAGTDFKASFKVRGSKEFIFVPVTRNNYLTISGNYSSPKFMGDRLPVDRKISKDGFTAKWVNICRTENGGYNREEPYGTGGVEMVVGVDSYRKVVRAIKYAFLIILLTFITVFATEVISRRNIPLLNYFLIGAALVVFYLLLLSISEHLSFGYAYLISTVMTVGLICIYLRTMLHSRRLALYNVGFLTVLYVCCYVMLSVSTFALLLGSLLLFIALAFAMNISLRLQNRENRG